MTAVPTLEKDARLEVSRSKFVPPFELDLTMRFYSPQENLEGLDHPRVRPFHRFMLEEYDPPLLGRRNVLLMMPCTASKPYPTSREHRRINAALLEAGFEPTGGVETPAGLADALDADEDPRVLDASPLTRGDVGLQRMVVSEPLGLVPYELVYRFRGKQSPAASYDDPGLFENRGTSVSPWRPDSTARPSAREGKWLWGDEERRAYVETHNRLTELMAKVLGRIGDRYERRIAWVAPGLTHRSFMLAADARAADGVASAKTAYGERLPLTGINDRLPGAVDVHPTRQEVDRALARLARRLERERGAAPSPRTVQAVYARGGGGATPLALPELLRELLTLLPR